MGWTDEPGHRHEHRAGHDGADRAHRVDEAPGAGDVKEVGDGVREDLG